jgi:hypothetical protein
MAGKDARYFVDDTPPVMTNANPQIIHKIKTTRQKTLDL